MIRAAFRETTKEESVAVKATSPTLLILRYRARTLRRWVGAHAFELFCLSPIIVGGVLWVLDRQLTQLREPLVQWFSGDGPVAGITGLGLALLLAAAGLPATYRELYDHRRANGYLDALPIPGLARFHASLAAELTRTLPAFGVLLLAAGALGGELLPSAAVLAERATRLLAALLVLATGRFATALLLGHFRLLARGGWLAIGILVLLVLGTPDPSSPWLDARALLLLPWAAPAAQLQAVFSGALQMPFAGDVSAQPWALALTALILYGCARGGYLAWHRRDLEATSRLGGRGRWWNARRLESRPRMIRPGNAVGVQVGRDVALVLRRFSQAVPLAAGIWLLLDGVALAVLADSRLPDLWRQRLAVAGLCLSVLAVVALVPFLLKHQLPRFWIEKSTGVDLEQIWKAKLWTATLLAGAPVLAGTVILLLAPFSLAERGTAILQLLAAAWIVTSIVALAVFEIAAQPLLGLLFGALLGLALSALFVFYPRAWWLWAALYVYVAAQIAGRATRRVRLLEASA